MLTQVLLSISLLSAEWIIWILSLLSIWSLAIIVERIWILRVRSSGVDELQEDLQEQVQKRRTTETEVTLRASKTAAARVVLRTVDIMKTASLPLEEGLAIAVSEEKLDLDRRIAILGTLGSNAPYIGLLGTVLGIIHAFHNLSLNIQGGPSVILKGISEALVATALGLFIAIPAVMAYNYFVRLIRKALIKSENVARAIVPALIK